MEVETRAAAVQLGVSQRQVQRLARTGRVLGRTVAGRRLVAARSLVAVSRSSGRGRRWDDSTAAAAAELLESGSTERISGSQRSRLRARLRAASVQELAYRMLASRVTLWRRTGVAGASTPLDDNLTATGRGIDVVVTRDARALARRERLVEDLDGETILVTLHTGAPATVGDIVLYAYGDERASAAARERIRGRQSELV